MRVLIIADDLTGALDSACAFAARGLRTRVALSRGDLEAALADPALAVISYASGTREIPAEAARAEMISLTHCFKTFEGLIFKKIDSRMKGNIAAELAPLLRLSGRPVLASPAIPKLGRLVENGAVTGAGIATPIPIAAALGVAARVPDVMSDTDLDAALPTELSENLYVGAAGLAEALARRLSQTEPREVRQLRGPMIMAIGSRDPVTLAQIAHSGVTVTPAPNGQVPPLRQEAMIVVQITKGVDLEDGPQVSNRFATGIVQQIRAAMPRTLFACGGETAHAILRMLGISALDLQGELMPGVPVAQTLDGTLTVITKSGGFGEPDLMQEMLNKFAKSDGNEVTSS